MSYILQVSTSRFWWALLSTVCCLHGVGGNLKQKGDSKNTIPHWKRKKKEKLRSGEHDLQDEREIYHFSNL